jgi:hypothetical protein
MPKNSWREATGFNHRSTDIKSAGARMNNMRDSGAKSSLHRRKVGGGDLAAESGCATAHRTSEISFVPPGDFTQNACEGRMRTTDESLRPVFAPQLCLAVFDYV